MRVVAVMPSRCYLRTMRRNCTAAAHTAAEALLAAAPYHFHTKVMFKLTLTLTLTLKPKRKP